MDLNTLTPVLVSIGFLLLLLVSISAPIIKTLYLFQLARVFGKNNQPAVVNCGVWGYYIPSIHPMMSGVSSTSVEYCSSRHLGYTIDQTVANVLGAGGEIEGTISKATTAAFVLHPIATCFAFLTLIMSLLICFRRKNGTLRTFSLITVFLSILTVAFTTAAFLVDIIVIAILHVRIRDATGNAVTVCGGSATWMTLVAAILLWVALLILLRDIRARKSNDWARVHG